MVNRRKHNPGRGKTAVCKGEIKAQGVGPQGEKHQLSKPLTLSLFSGASVMAGGKGFAQLQMPQAL